MAWQGGVTSLQGVALLKHNADLEGHIAGVLIFVIFVDSGCLFAYSGDTIYIYSTTGFGLRKNKKMAQVLVYMLTAQICNKTHDRGGAAPPCGARRRRALCVLLYI